MFGCAAGDVPVMQWIMWGASALVLLQVLVYLPAAPPTPPCAVRQVEASLGLHVKRTDSNSVICQMREVSSSYQSVSGLPPLFAVLHLGGYTEICRVPRVLWC